uniref:Beta-barrel assembly machine subunit BamE n=1 Tax=Candidatus Kentrum sp. TUN TaxID=2126343 RepID=A0A450ZLY7_9GAMM|nr:MAG: hypothetical protein BECKTUN1418F_GA0071002_105417 [Candidatus Kentron sp. TUN]VFK59629.1 MAG: hypothetical protein BECKTUN1418E_GA0071001_105417 [Candidatus Kentron sp. TUN]
MLKRERVVVLFAITIATLIAGCANIQYGKDFDATKAQTFQKGKTSRADIIAAMGEPTSTGISMDGSFIEYQYHTFKGGGISSVLSVYGVGSTSYENKIKLCKFVFNVNDKLKDYTCSEGAQNSNLGE